MTSVAVHPRPLRVGPAAKRDFLVHHRPLPSTGLAVSLAVKTQHPRRTRLRELFMTWPRKYYDPNTVLELRYQTKGRNRFVLFM